MYKKLLRMGATVMFGLSIGQSALSETFDFEPDMQVSLGATWNPYSPFSRAALSSCFDSTVPARAPSATNTLQEKLIQSFSELEEKSGIKITASGSTSFGLATVKADASLETLREAFNTNRSVAYSVLGTREYSAQLLEDATLNAIGNERIEQANSEGDPEAFYKRCGRSIVTSVRKRSTVSVLYVFRFSQASSRKRIEAAVTVAASSAGSSGNASVNLLQEAKSIDQSTTLDVYLFQDGVADTSGTLADFLTIEPGDITSVRAKVEEALDEIAFENAPIFRFSADAISNFFDVDEESDWRYIGRAYASLDHLKSQADRIVRRYFTLEDLQSDVEKGLASFKDGSEAKLLKEKESLISLLSSLADNARSCFESPEVTCPVEETPIDSRTLHYVDVILAENGGWNARAHNHYYDSHGEVVHFGAAYWPTITIRNQRLIRTLELTRNGNPLRLLDADSIANLISNSVVSFQPVWSSTHSAHSYCWRGNWTGCDNWAADTKGHMNGLKQNEANYAYEVIITDIEGGTTTLDIGNASNYSF
ncbi:hypothetical protein J7382_19520 [Shimia sp. R11_0]|uniref:hypothetical protein n=1 Tax=Shimia sp. R11_0 TaxID=2821096 RepID=UPI001ADC3E83|nr:hypothetical protein [Shimia sp. R11_0]MBO9479738.1 hypothetical protein [Shimia sp. R11_0]